jgi:hypothetical protein
VSEALPYAGGAECGVWRARNEPRRLRHSMAWHGMAWQAVKLLKENITKDETDFAVGVCVNLSRLKRHKHQHGSTCAVK